MAPRDFYAMCEGYENKQHAHQELVRMQTYMIVSPYLPKGSNYGSFKNMWQFGWERQNMPKLIMPGKEEMEQIRVNHQRILEQVKNNKNAGSRT
jgi:hypothetical protein